MNRLKIIDACVNSYRDTLGCTDELWCKFSLVEDRESIAEHFNVDRHDEVVMRNLFDLQSDDIIDYFSNQFREDLTKLSDEALQEELQSWVIDCEYLDEEELNALYT